MCCLYSRRCFCWVKNSRLRFFFSFSFFSTLKVMLHCLIACSSSTKKSAVICVFVTVCGRSFFFSLFLIKIFSCHLFLSDLMMMCIGILLCFFSLCLWSFLYLWIYSYHQIWKDSGYFSFPVLSCPSETPVR